MGPQDSLKLPQTLNKNGSLGFFETTPETGHGWSSRFFQTTSKTNTKYPLDSLKNKHKIPPRFFKTTSKINTKQPRDS